VYDSKSPLFLTKGERHCHRRKIVMHVNLSGPELRDINLPVLQGSMDIKADGVFLNGNRVEVGHDLGVPEPKGNLKIKSMAISTGDRMAVLLVDGSLIETTVDPKAKNKSPLETMWLTVFDGQKAETQKLPMSMLYSNAENLSVRFNDQSKSVWNQNQGFEPDLSPDSVWEGRRFIAVSDTLSVTVRSIDNKDQENPLAISLKTAGGMAQPGVPNIDAKLPTAKGENIADQWIASQRERRPGADMPSTTRDQAPRTRSRLG
jgi:hypothetical protein